MKALAIFGTRPEAIKLAPVIKALEKTDGARVAVCVTSQHRELLDQTLSTFDIHPDYDLDIMQPFQSPVEVLSRALPKLERMLREVETDVVLVQGDTTSALAGALPAFHKRIPVAHVEAGLRSGDPNLPFPEEANRRMIASLSTMHFAPTEGAAKNLLTEGYPEDAVFVTGNTVVDALKYILSSQAPFVAPTESAADRRLIVVTLHRRETLGSKLEGLCHAIRSVAERHQNEMEIVFPVHMNPRVRDTVLPALSDLDRVQLVDPLDYPSFIHLLARSEAVVTDSGGVQEEAAALGKTVLIARDVTERPEVLKIGCGKLIGTHPGRFEHALETFLAEPRNLHARDGSTVFGDGKAAGRIVSQLQRFCSSEDRVAADAA
jgi:UDP-N-acetylglucosamine 2-epimerase (non-hydrolysing)